MDKKMHPVQVKTGTNGWIEIGGPDERNELWNVVRLTPEQVDTVVKWLGEAKRELIGAA